MYKSPNSKYYIGQTTQGAKRRAQHIYSAYNIRDKTHHTPFHKAIAKYGIDSFEYTILWVVIGSDDFVRKRLNEKEVYYINKYDSYHNGYNCTVGGDSSGWGDKHPSCGKKLKDSHKKKLKESRAKRVYQYDLDGNYLNTFPSAAEASREVGVDSSGIIESCKTKRRTTKKFQWRYEKEICEKWFRQKSQHVFGRTGKLSGKSKTVYQYTIDGVFIQSFVSVVEAIKVTGCRDLYHKVGKNQMYKGFLWLYEEPTK